MNVLDKKLVLTNDQLEATGGELEISARIMSSLVLSKSMTGDDFGQHIIWCTMMSKHNVMENLIVRSPSMYPVMMQIFGLYPLNSSCVGFEVMLLLQQPLGDTGVTLGQYIIQVVKQLNSIDCEQQYQDSQIKNTQPAYEKILNQIEALLEQKGFMEKIEALEQKRLTEFKAKNLQDQQLDQNPQEKKLVQQEPPQYRTTYDPRNSEKKVNTSGEIGFLGYFS